jgi:hypothetical protein
MSPVADSTGWTFHYGETRPVFRAELQNVRRQVIDFRAEDTSLEAMRLIIKTVAAIDALEKSLEALAYYVRHEDTRADDRDRESEIHHARYGW